MPLFFFHVCNGNGFVEDEEGRDLPDEAAARSAALVGARDIMAEEMRAGQLNPASFIEVEDAERQAFVHLALQRRLHGQSDHAALKRRSRLLPIQKDHPADAAGWPGSGRSAPKGATRRRKGGNTSARQAKCMIALEGFKGAVRPRPGSAGPVAIAE